MLFREIICIDCENCVTHKNEVYGKTYISLMLKQMVCIFTTRIKRLNEDMLLLTSNPQV
jgi:NADH dehydrogenase/NADH:ubiquinone oxidoreductase subunit G